MVLEISVQKYTKNFIFDGKIFPLKFSPYYPSTFYFLNFNLYPSTFKSFMEKISRWKIFCSVYSCMLTLNMIFISHKNQLLTIEVLKTSRFL